MADNAAMDMDVPLKTRDICVAQEALSDPSGLFTSHLAAITKSSFYQRTFRWAQMGSQACCYAGLRSPVG